MVTLDLRERFELMVASGQVCQEAAEAAEGLLNGVAAYLGRPVNEESGSMLATHLVMAMERLLRGEVLEEPPEAIMEEAHGYPAEWAAAERLLTEAVSRLGRPVPTGEVAYLTFHIRSLREQV